VVEAPTLKRGPRLMGRLESVLGTDTGEGSMYRVRRRPGARRRTIRAPDRRGACGGNPAGRRDGESVKRRVTPFPLFAEAVATRTGNTARYIGISTYAG